MAATYGFVYFVSNHLMPGIYKIGYTDQHPQIRVAQLSASTSCPMPFELAGCFGCEDARSVEKEIHQEWDSRRVNQSREFFQITAAEALAIIREYASPWSSPILSQPLELTAHDDQEKANAQWLVEYFHSQNADPIYWPEKRRSTGFD